MKLTQLYWIIFRLLVRGTGVTFVGVGSIVILWGGALLARPTSFVTWYGEQTSDIGPKCVIGLAGIVILALGVLLIKAPFHPPSSWSFARIKELILKK